MQFRRWLPCNYAVVLAILFVGANFFVATPAQAQTSLTYGQLVERLIDLRQLAVVPEPGETCQQWSSWDRASQYDAENKKYVNWSANNDGPGIIRKEGTSSVVAEMEGPGCIWRIWSALAKNGHVKIYLDGSDQPAVDLPFQEYFSGKTAPFNYPMLSYNLEEQGCRGQNLYFPIPYRKSCKVVADPEWGRYYHFVYTTYPKGTELPTFSKELVQENAALLKDVDRYLTTGMGIKPPIQPKDCETISDTFTLPVGKSLALDIEGPRAIVALRGNMKLGDRDDEMAALREVVLKVTWDDASKPGVWCPIGDFFGTAPGRNLYKCLTTGVTEEDAYAFWYMPFAKKAHIELVNEGAVDRELEFELLHGPLTRPFDGLGHFHCKWHRDAHSLSEDRWPDWVMLNTQGRGRFCGVQLHVWNPRGGWWGEGDEKFFVDGEKFPSTFGTGSEDYFGYAWCHPGLFQRPYHCQTMTMGNKGHQSVLRWHVADNIPFQTSFEGCIEKYYRTEEKGTLYAVTAVWYQAPGGNDPYGEIPVEDRHDYYKTPPLTAGGFPVLGTPPGNVRTQQLTHFEGTWRNGEHLWWTNAKPGDKLELAVEVQEAGTYDVYGVFTQAPDYGIVQLRLNGEKAGDPLDLYHPSVAPTDRISLGRHPLKAGRQILSVEILGANEAAKKSYMFGLDYLEFEISGLGSPRAISDCHRSRDVSGR